MHDPQALLDTPTAELRGFLAADPDADRPHRVLLAAPEGTAAAALEVLHRCRCLVHAVADCGQLIAAAADQLYDLILLDLILLDPVLPGEDATAVVAGLHALPSPFGDLPVLALGTAAGGLDRDALLAAGLDGVFDPGGAEADAVLAHWLLAADDPNWGLDAAPEQDLPLINRRLLSQLEEELGLEPLPDVLQTFFDETARRMAFLETRVAAGDTLAARDQAHALKGSAGTFGALALRRAVHEMEQAGREGDQARITALLPEVMRLSRLTSGLLRARYAGLLGADPGR